jgi:hypothetical protein
MMLTRTNEKVLFNVTYCFIESLIVEMEVDMMDAELNPRRAVKEDDDDE